MDNAKIDIERLKIYELRQMGDGIRKEIKSLSHAFERIGNELYLIRSMMEKNNGNVIVKNTYDNDIHEENDSEVED